MDTTLKRLLRSARKHCPADLQRKIDSAVGPQPAESMGEEGLQACLVDAVDARDFDDALHFAERIQNLRSSNH